VLPKLAICYYDSDVDPLDNCLIHSLDESTKLEIEKVNLEKNKISATQYDHAVIIVPSIGFEGDQIEDLKAVLNELPDAQLIILGDSNMYEDKPRERATIISLYEEIEKNFAVPIAVPLVDSTYKCQAFREKTIFLIIEKTWIGLQKRVISMWTRNVDSMTTFDVFPVCETLNDVKSLYIEKSSLQTIARELHSINDHLSQLKDSNQRSLHESKEIVDESYILSLKMTHKTSFVSRPALAISGEMHKVRSEILQMIEDNWKEPPDISLKNWSQGIKEFLQTPRFLLPVVGIFSSGKTTFFNEIIGLTPNGKPCLRTAGTHNTASLLRFHYKIKGEPNQVRFQWRNFIKQKLVFNLIEHDAVTVPFDCIVQEISNNGLNTYLTLLSTDDNSKIDVLEVPKSLILNSIQHGSLLKKGGAVSKKIVLNEGTIHSLEKQVYINTNTVNALLDLFDRNLLKDCTLEIRWCDVVHYGSGIHKNVREKSNILSHHSSVISILQVLIESVSNPRSSIAQNIIIENNWKVRFPIDITFSAKVELGKLPKSYKLENDDDWDRYQGDPTLDNSTKKRSQGFAESNETAWLLEIGDVYIDNQLFESINMVDTPGLNSINQNHELITMDYIGRGDAFIVMVKLGKQVDDYYLSKTLIEIKKRLTLLNVPIDEWACRIFIVLNWFHQLHDGKYVPIISEDAAQGCITRLEKNVEDTLKIIIQAYVVDLSSNVKTDRVNLVGRRSIFPLLSDLKKLIKESYMKDQLNSRRELLDKHWHSLNVELENITTEVSDNEFSSKRKTLDDLGKNKKIPKMLMNLVTGQLDELKELTGKISNLTFSRKEDFDTNCDSGTRLMKKFNALRESIRTELPSELVSKIRKVVIDKYGLFEVSNPEIHDVVEQIPIYHFDQYNKEVESIYNNWPSLIKRGWNRFLRIFSGFETHATVKGNEIRDKFFPQSAQVSRNDGAIKIQNKLDLWIRKTCEAYSNKLSTMLDTMERDNNAKKLEYESRKKSLVSFQQVYDDMISALVRFNSSE